MFLNVSSTKIVLPLLLAKKGDLYLRNVPPLFPVKLSSKFNLDFGPSVSNNRCRGVV